MMKRNDEKKTKQLMQAERYIHSVEPNFDNWTTAVDIKKLIRDAYIAGQNEIDVSKQ